MFIISGCFCCKLRRMPGDFHCCAFSGSVVLFVVLFLLIQISYLLVLLNILSGVELCVVL